MQQKCHRHHQFQSEIYPNILKFSAELRNVDAPSLKYMRVVLWQFVLFANFKRAVKNNDREAFRSILFWRKLCSFNAQKEEFIEHINRSIFGQNMGES